MLAAYLDIRVKEGTQQPKPGGKPKPSRQRKVEPYDSGPSHAQFHPESSKSGRKQKKVASDVEDDCVGAGADSDIAEPETPMESDAELSDDKDSDSCLSYDISEGCDSAIVSADDDDPFLGGKFPSKANLMSKRRARASAIPVHSGPELWRENDDFIE